MEGQAEDRTVLVVHGKNIGRIFLERHGQVNAQKKDAQRPQRWGRMWKASELVVNGLRLCAKRAMRYLGKGSP